MNAPPQKSLSTLKRELFNKNLHVMALRVRAHVCKYAMACLKGSLLAIPKIPSIILDPQCKTNRLLLLDHEIQAKTIDGLPEKVKTFALENDAELKDHQIQLEYSYWTADQILRAILPDNIEIPSSFETIGHIAHLNLKDEHADFKKIIGQVILDKSTHIRTVVNKTGNIENKFRFFKMELLAGDDDFMADLRESDCQFKFDFSKVYWNSRLQGEHQRIIKLFNEGDLICDVFAGVGPFAIPAAKNAKCIVFANDLNPSSYLHLKEGIILNKVIGSVKIEGF